MGTNVIPSHGTLSHAHPRSIYTICSNSSVGESAVGVYAVWKSTGHRQRRINNARVFIRLYHMRNVNTTRSLLADEQRIDGRLCECEQSSHSRGEQWHWAAVKRHIRKHCNNIMFSFSFSPLTDDFSTMTKNCVRVCVCVRARKSRIRDGPALICLC